MENFLKEIYIGIKEKVSSPFLRYFFISWIITNYKFIYILFFQDEKNFLDKYGILKIDYLRNELIYGSLLWNLWFYLFWPLIITLFFIYFFPIINRKFLEIYRENKDKEEELSQKYKLKEISREKERSLRRLEDKRIKLEEKKLQDKIDKERLDREELKKYFNDLKRKEYFKYFAIISNIVNSKTDYNDIKELYKKVPQEILNIYIGLGLIILNKGPIDPYTMEYSIVFTEKGKIISELYYEDNFLDN